MYYLINSVNMIKKAIIIGAGPAGLTAAYELVTKTDIKPIIIEKTSGVGGISKTIVYKGNRIDIGGHRFFSKSDRIMDLWQEILPIQGFDSKDDILDIINFQKKSRLVQLQPGGPNPELTDKVMLKRNRLSRIFFLRKFFDYPVSLNINTITNLGLIRIIKIGWSYFKIRLFPIKNINSLEDFFINRFGVELYKTFFKEYTEKVWGIACSQISADWGEQRIKKLSISRAILHALRKSFKKNSSIDQKSFDTSLIEQFLYPKLGPGQMWESISKIIEEKGGQIIFDSEVVDIKLYNNNVFELGFFNMKSNSIDKINGDYFFSTMPIVDLIKSMGDNVPAKVKLVSDGLKYRDFITVGLLLNRLKIKNKSNINSSNDLLKDCWVYIQERDVKVGRIQIFNNWSPYMLADINKVWIGLEYFCNKGDNLWEMCDKEFINFAIGELVKIDFIDKNDVIDSTIIRMEKTYPAYFGSYSQFEIIREYVDNIDNLFLIGRNGMHKYNNQDHSMLTAITAVNNIITGVKSKNNIWDINTEEDFHEKKSKY